MSVVARFWFAPGVEVYPNTAVPYDLVNGPERYWRFAIREPFAFCAVRMEDMCPEDIAPIQTADFRLTDWSPGGEVAHYELDSQPPRGWRWLAHRGEIIPERIKQSGAALAHLAQR